MGPLDAIFHLANFLLPALAMALLLPSLVRLVWWRRLRSVAWSVMARRVALVGVVILIAGWAMNGRDGAMATYATLVMASALVVWWTAFKGRA